MHGSRRKIPSKKKSRQAALRGGMDLIAVLKGQKRTYCVSKNGL
jgi:hypothetical protein